MNSETIVSSVGDFFSPFIIQSGFCLFSLQKRGKTKANQENQAEAERNVSLRRMLFSLFFKHGVFVSEIQVSFSPQDAGYQHLPAGPAAPCLPERPNWNHQ